MGWENFSWSQHSRKGAEYEVKGKTLIIHMKEDLDHHNAVPIREQADKRILSGNIRNVVFDFSNVRFMDSSGIGVVLGRYKRLRLLGGGRVAVADVNCSVDRIFSMAGMYQLIEKYNCYMDAVNRFSSL